MAVHPPRAPGGRPRYVLEFTGPDGPTTTRDDLQVRQPVREGDEVTLAHPPGRPADLVVLPPDLGLRSALRGARTGLLFGTLVVLVTAAVAAFGVELIREVVSGHVDPDLLP
ncbi:hypothetical protein [Kitasatospora sp. NPDC085879]|uniref:hypothetical protein n=1 Tax=Kitasatospora sp. NPDC085879 TaxID=3154769 RepID=UPI0034360761